MTCMNNEFEKAASLLQSVLQNEITAEAALAKWPPMSKGCDSALGNAYHRLYHYMADEDIQIREPKYGERQRSILQKSVSELLKRA
jgi:hypothetical protein